MALNVATGTYTGDGSSPRGITGLGFTPKVVIIFATTGSVNTSATLFKTDQHPQGASSVSSTMGDSGQAVGIDSLDSNGFTVRGEKNTSGVDYYYLALAGTDVKTGTYTGNNSDNRNITGVGFQPEWVVLQGDTGNAVQKPASSGNSTDIAQYFSDFAEEPNGIQALQADGFQIGTDGTVNASGKTYYYFAIKASGSFKTGSYSGDNNDNRSITGVGFEPTAVLVKSASSTQAGWRTSAHSGDLTSLSKGNTTPITNAIQAFEADGFQVGNNAVVNSSGGYYYVAFAPTPFFGNAFFIF
jgi:hypothetical protein